MEWRGREWSGVMEGGRGRKGVVWCDGGLLFVDGGWSSIVGVAGWALLSEGGRLWVGRGHPWVDGGCL